MLNLVIGAIQSMQIFESSLPQGANDRPFGFSGKVQLQVIEHIVTETDFLEQKTVLDAVYVRQLVGGAVQFCKIGGQGQKSQLVFLTLQLS